MYYEFIFPLFFGLIAFFSYWKIQGVATNKRYYDDIPYPMWSWKASASAFEAIDRFKTITNHLTDKKKQNIYNWIYYAFIVSAILTPISMGLPGLIMILMGEF